MNTISLGFSASQSPGSSDDSIFGRTFLTEFIQRAAPSHCHDLVSSAPFLTQAIFQMASQILPE